MKPANPFFKIYGTSYTQIDNSVEEGEEASLVGADQIENGPTK